MGIISDLLSFSNENSINYRDCEINKPLHFSNCNVKEKACFQYSHVKKHITFEDCIFEDDIIWGDEKQSEACSTVDQDIFFSRCTFKKRVLMDGIECGGGIYFNDCHFEYISNDEKDYSLSISCANIRIGIDINNCNFFGGINFNGTTIEKMGCFLTQVRVSNNKCSIDFVAANFAKELSIKECDINCLYINANCITVSHSHIGSTNQVLFQTEHEELKRITIESLQESFQNNKELFPNKESPIIKSVIINSFLVRIYTDFGLFFGTYYDGKTLSIVKANTLKVEWYIDFSYAKVDDKLSFANCLIEGDLLNISNIHTRDLELASSYVNIECVDYRHLISDWILNIHDNVLSVSSLTFNGTTCYGGLFLKNIYYIQKEQSREEWGIDVSFSYFGKNIDISSIIFAKDENCNQNILIINFQSTKVCNRFICCDLSTEQNDIAVLFLMQSMDIHEWEHHIVDLNKIYFDVNNIQLSLFDFSDDSNTTVQNKGYDSMLNFITPDSLSHYQSVCERILRLSDSTKEKADEIRRIRTKFYLRKKYKGLIYLFINLVYRLTDYGLSNKRLVSHALYAIFIMGIINMIYSVDTFKNDFLSWRYLGKVFKHFLQSFIDFFSMLNMNGNQVINICEDSLNSYSCFLLPYKVYGFFLISILIASISGVFKPHNE